MIIIAIEGIDGVGKQTQTLLLKASLEQLDLKVETTSFPNYDSIEGESIGLMLKDGTAFTTDPTMMAVKYSFDRYLTLSRIPESDVLIIDRYVLSNAFQVERGADWNWILDFEYDLMDLPEPDYTFFLDVDPHTSILLKRGLESDLDVYESDIEYQSRVRNVYLEQLAKTDNAHIINCHNNDLTLKSVSDIHQSITQLVFPLQS